MIHIRSGWPLKAFCRKLAIVLKFHKGAQRTLQRLNGSLLFQTSASQAHVAQGEVEVRSLLRSSMQQEEMIGFSNVDLHEAYWKALCGHWSQSYRGEYEPHPARVSLEARGTWQAPSSRSFRGLLTSGPLDALSPSAGGVHKRSPRFLSAVRPTYVGPGGKLALGAPRRVGEWEVYLGTGSTAASILRGPGRSANRCCSRQEGRNFSWEKSLIIQV